MHSYNNTDLDIKTSIGIEVNALTLDYITINGQKFYKVDLESDFIEEFKEKIFDISLITISSENIAYIKTLKNIRYDSSLDSFICRINECYNWGKLQ
jgi:hypothetical protein